MRNCFRNTLAAALLFTLVFTTTSYAGTATCPDGREVPLYEGPCPNPGDLMNPYTGECVQAALISVYMMRQGFGLKEFCERSLPPTPGNPPPWVEAWVRRYPYAVAGIWVAGMIYAYCHENEDCFINQYLEYLGQCTIHPGTCGPE